MDLGVPGEGGKVSTNTNTLGRVGKRVRIMPSDHSAAGREGTVIEERPCGLVINGKPCDCGYPDFLVRLDSGVQTTVYSPEADNV